MCARPTCVTMIWKCLAGLKVLTSQCSGFTVRPGAIACRRAWCREHVAHSPPLLSPYGYQELTVQLSRELNEMRFLGMAVGCKQNDYLPGQSRYSGSQVAITPGQSVSKYVPVA